MTYTSKKIRTEYLDNMDFKKIQRRENDEDKHFVDEAVYLIDDMTKDQALMKALDDTELIQKKDIT